MDSLDQDETHEAARRLVLEHGWNSTCYQTLNPGIERWIAPGGRSFVGFVRSGGLAIVAGAPVCAPDSLEEALRDWEAYAHQQGLKVCYFGAESRVQNATRRTGAYAQVALGSQPEWSAGSFVAQIRGDASLRAQLSRARNKGVMVQEWQGAHSENDSELRRVLHEWLATRGLPTLHFLVEPDTLGDLRDRRIFVAELGGRPVGFVTLCPAPARNWPDSEVRSGGWLTEQFVRGQQAPNGTVELMLWHAASALPPDSYFTMGIVPLIRGRADSPSHDVREPAWLAFARSWALAHLARFYNFQGLRWFKAKFHPEKWEPVVVIVEGRKFRLSHLRAIARAFTRISPELALAKGVARAGRTELASAWRALEEAARL